MSTPRIDHRDVPDHLKSRLTDLNHVGAVLQIAYYGSRHPAMTDAIEAALIKAKASGCRFVQPATDSIEPCTEYPDGRTRWVIPVIGAVDETVMRKCLDEVRIMYPRRVSEITRING